LQDSCQKRSERAYTRDRKGTGPIGTSFFMVPRCRQTLTVQSYLICRCIYSSIHSMNVSATFNIFRLLYKPSLCLPQATVSTFNDLPVPSSKAFRVFCDGHEPDIRAVVLDKDDCFAAPRENVIDKPYYVSSISDFPSQFFVSDCINLVRGICL